MDPDSVNKYDYRYSNEYDNDSGSEDRNFVAVEPRDVQNINKIEYDPNNWKKNPYIFPVNDMNLLKEQNQAIQNMVYSMLCLFVLIVIIIILISISRILKSRGYDCKVDY